MTRAVEVQGRQGSRVYKLPVGPVRKSRGRLNDPTMARSRQPGGEDAAPKRTPARTLRIAARLRAWFRGRPTLVLVSGGAQS